MDIGVDDVRRVVADRLPGRLVRSVTRLGGGLDNVAFDVDGELVVRFAREPDPARLDREARLLALVAGVSPLRVPVPRFVAPDLGCLGYDRLPGTPLLDVRPAQRSAWAEPVAAELGRLLTAVHAVPSNLVAGLVDCDDEPAAGWLAEAGALYRTVAAVVPQPYRRPVEAFLAAPPPAAGYAPVFCHNDLGVEHVLVDPATGAVTGVIDWGDAAVADPAYDFARLHRDLGPAALDAALVGYPGAGRELRERAVFHARCSVFEDLAYGLGTGRAAYVDKSLTALEWLFADRAVSYG
jgi:aminoglycoside phosphotransferase (APT) family kinase protein